MRHAVGRQHPRRRRPKWKGVEPLQDGYGDSVVLGCSAAKRVRTVRRCTADMVDVHVCAVVGRQRGLTPPQLMVWWWRVAR